MEKKKEKEKERKVISCIRVRRCELESIITNLIT